MIKLFKIIQRQELFPNITLRKIQKEVEVIKVERAEVNKHQPRVRVTAIRE